MHAKGKYSQPQIHVMLKWFFVVIQWQNIRPLTKPKNAFEQQ